MTESSNILVFFSQQPDERVVVASQLQLEAICLVHMKLDSAHEVLRRHESSAAACEVNQLMFFLCLCRGQWLGFGTKLSNWRLSTSCLNK